MGVSPQLEYVDKSQGDSTVGNQSFLRTLAVFNILCTVCADHSLRYFNEKRNSFKNLY